MKATDHGDEQDDGESAVLPLLRGAACGRLAPACQQPLLSAIPLLLSGETLMQNTTHHHSTSYVGSQETV